MPLRKKQVTKSLEQKSCVWVDACISLTKCSPVAPGAAQRYPMLEMSSSHKGWQQLNSQLCY